MLATFLLEGETMCFGIDVLWNLSLTLIDYVPPNLRWQVIGYIDPNTMHHVFTFLAPVLACFAVVASTIISAVYLLRHHLVSWFRKASGVKLVLLWLALVSVLAIIIVVSCKLILYLTAN
jgi:hypothetical protein